MSTKKNEKKQVTKTTVKVEQKKPDTISSQRSASYA